MRFGVLELVIIFAALLLFIGPKQLPKLAESIKKSKKIVDETVKKEPEQAVEIEKTASSEENKDVQESTETV